MLNITLEKKTLLQHLKQQGISDKILDIIASVSREKFVLNDHISQAYLNTPLPIECKQTISQPYIVARMTELLCLNRKYKKILEIGTGSGYQAAILSYFAEEVYTIERYAQLYSKAKKTLSTYTNVNCFYGDGFNGVREYALYDGIIITAVVNELPFTLFNQLAIEGVIVYPQRINGVQKLIKLIKKQDHIEKFFYEDVRFVPMLSGEV